MGKVKKWMEDDMQDQVNKATKILNDLIPKNYNHNNLQQIRDDVVKVFTEQHSDLLYAFTESSTGVEQVDKENAENALSDVVDDMVKEYADSLR